MAYRFKLDEPVGKGVRRIAREQLARASTELGANISPANVHECRKTIKRLRALLRLIRPEIGEKSFNSHNSRLRKAAGLLSSSRDQTILLDTAAKLEERYHNSHGQALTALQTLMKQSPAATAAVLEDATATKARSLLAEEAVEFTALKLPGKGFEPLAAGLEECFDNGRRALTKARRSPSNEAYHDLRKTVQWHWRHMTLLSRCWPEYFELRMSAARELSQLLGDDHDLAILEVYVRDNGAGALAPHAKELTKLIRERQAELRRDSRRRAERLFAERSGEFVHGVGIYWRTGRRLQPMKGPVDDDTAHTGQPAPTAKPLRKLVTKAAR